MTCLEAQSNIISYIENRLDKDDKIDFLKHVQGCSDCKEELDIYYTMIVGMRQSDDNLPLSRDFSRDLEDKIERDLKQNRQRKGFFVYSFLVILIGLFGFSIAGYINFLNIIHNEEQLELKEKQGEYYFSSTFDDVMFNPDSVVININIEPEQAEQSFYSKVREYNAYNK